MVRAICTCAKLAKINFKAAFRCVPVHPSDRWLLCMKCCNSFYADLALPFGLKSSPCVWERYATLTEWILRRAGVAFIVHYVVHYVDDFLFGGSADSDQCAEAVAIIVREFKRLSIPLSLSKFEAEATPSTIARFLCIVIDTLRMEARLDLSVSPPSKPHSKPGSRSRPANRQNCSPSSAPCPSQPKWCPPAARSCAA
jgi:hypothetical protein